MAGKTFFSSSSVFYTRKFAVTDAVEVRPVRDRRTSR
jgi:hypothetical protein